MSATLESTASIAPRYRGRALLSSAAIQVPALVVVMTGAALYEAWHLNSFADADVWWHLRTGTGYSRTMPCHEMGFFPRLLRCGEWIATGV
jgi:hypothetical protein